MNEFELSQNEKEILERHEKFRLASLEKERLFWAEEYPNLSNDEKVKFWLADIYRGMRSQGEAVGDEYTEFSKVWYDWVKSLEENFDYLFNEVVKRLGFDFDWDEYHKRIGKNQNSSRNI